MSFNWYIKRLANMSIAEVVHRAGEYAKKRSDRNRNYRWEDFTSTVSAVVPGLRDRTIANLTDANRTAILRSSEALANGEFSVHGVDWPKRDPNNLFPADVWRLDPVTGLQWPGADVFCFKIPYRHERTLGDVKFVWDFNRLQFMQPLAVAASLGDARALTAIEQAVKSWMDTNPPFRGLSWNSGIELALRALSLVFVATLCEQQLSSETHRRISTVLSAHLYWMARYPSRFSSANNHLIAEAAGEFVVGSLVTDAAEAAKIAKKARATLEREAELQIFADGSAAEQSPTYGAFSGEMLLFSAMVADCLKKPFAPIVSQRLIALADGNAWLGDETALVPAVGDDDEGKVFTTNSAHEHRYPASITAAICGYYGVPYRMAESTDAPELREAVFGRPKESATRPNGMKMFPDGGFSVVRGDWAGHQVMLTMDHGQLGYLSIAAHGHADANAITLTLDGKAVLVDPGTYLYHSGGAWRDWFRGTLAHNTLSVAKADQSIIAGAFNWSHKAVAALGSVEDGVHWSLSASHDGYSGRFGVDHHRTVQATDAGITVIDQLLPKPSSLPSEIVFQFAADLTVKGEGRHWTALRDGIAVLSLTFSAEGDTVCASGGDLGKGGWVSPRFGLKVPAPRLVWRGVVPPEGVLTELRF